jgi:hypothetical protein
LSPLGVLSPAYLSPRKAGGEQVTIESSRGAIAFIDACRSARILQTMTTKEHEMLAEVQPDIKAPGFYFRIFNGKRNFAPPADLSDWFEIMSIELRNGDNVGVVANWEYPGIKTDIPPETADCIIADIDKGMDNGQRYSNHNAAGKRGAFLVMQNHYPEKTETECRRTIATWIGKGKPLYEKKYQDPVRGELVVGLYARKLGSET